MVRVSLGLILVAAAPAADVRAEPVERRIATLAPEGSMWMTELEEGAAEVTRQTDGRIQTKFYSGGSQGDERDVVRKMRLGQLDGAGLTSIGLGMIYPGIRVMELPYLFESVEEIDYVRARVWPYFQEKFAEKGFELLAAGDVGWIHVFSVKTVDSLQDLREVKMWAWTDDAIVRKLFKAMGVDGVPLGVPAVLAALQTGRIEACYGSPLAAVALQWHTEVKYMSKDPVGYGLAGMVMRTAIWDQASIADKETQLAVGRERMKDSIDRIRRDNKRALKAMIKNGLTLIQFPADLRDALEQEGRGLWDDMAGELYTRDELDMVLEHRAAFRAKNAKKSSAKR
jgi:TRAP-type C4-dicarboxylate transport system substrate-binding protein